MYRDNISDLLLVTHAQLSFIHGWSCAVLYFSLIFKYYVSSGIYFEKSVLNNVIWKHEAKVCLMYESLDLGFISSMPLTQ